MTTIRSRKPAAVDAEIVIDTLTAAMTHLPAMTGEEVTAVLQGIFRTLDYQKVVKSWSIATNFGMPGFNLAWKMVGDPQDEWFNTFIRATVV